LRVRADYLVHSVFDEPVDEEFIALARKNLFVRTGYRLAYAGLWQPTEAERRHFQQSFTDQGNIVLVGNLTDLTLINQPREVYVRLRYSL
jgi:hypothetical protein